jgi:hypothetical protein
LKQMFRETYDMDIDAFHDAAEKYAQEQFQMQADLEPRGWRP